MISADYRDKLRNVFAARTAARRGYSLRSFARYLTLSPGFLSDVLKGRKHLSEATALRVSQVLRWAPEETAAFLDLVRIGRVRDDALRQHVEAGFARRPQAARVFKPVTAPNEELLWHYLVVSELFDLTSFRSDVRWMARKLRLTVVEVRQALAWLTRQGVIERTGTTYKKVVTSFAVKKPDETAATRLYRKMLDLAKSATQPRSPASEFAALNLSFPPEKLGEAIALIRECQAAIASLSDPSRNTSVYHLGVQFFRLDQPDA